MIDLTALDDARFSALAPNPKGTILRMATLSENNRAALVDLT